MVLIAAVLAWGVRVERLTAADSARAGGSIALSDTGSFSNRERPLRVGAEDKEAQLATQLATATASPAGSSGLEPHTSALPQFREVDIGLDGLTFPMGSGIGAATSSWRRRLVSSAQSSWAQLIAGSETEFSGETLAKPSARYRFSAHGIPRSIAGTLVNYRLLVFGGQTFGALSELYSIYPPIADTTSGTSVSGDPSHTTADEAACTTTNCLTWTLLDASEVLESCYSTVPAGAEVRYNCTVSTIAASASTTLPRFGQASAMLYNGADSNVPDTSRMLVWGGATASSFLGDGFELFISNLRWERVGDGSSFSMRVDQLLHALGRAAAGSAYVEPAWPSARVDAAAAAVRARALDSSSVLRATVTGPTTTTRASSADETAEATAQISQLDTDGVTVARYQTARPLGSPSAQLTTAAGTQLLWTKLSSTSVRATPDSAVAVTESTLLVDDHGEYTAGLSTFKRVVNVTVAGDVTIDTASSQTVLRTATFQLEFVAVDNSESVSDVIMFGGWDGSSYLDEVWRYQAAQPAKEMVWRPHKLQTVTLDSPTADPNYDATLHPFFPALPTRRRWDRVETQGSGPSGRAGAAAAVLGSVGGGSGLSRYALVVVGGQSAQAFEEDTWELSLEDSSGGQAATYAGSCLGDPASSWFTVADPASGAVSRRLAGSLTGPELEDALEEDLGHLVGQATVSFASSPTVGQGVMLTPVQRLCGAAAASTWTLALAAANSSQTALAVTLGSTDGSSTVSLTQTQAFARATTPMYTWTSVNTTLSVGRRAFAATAVMALSGTQRLFLHGGWDAVTPLSDLWMFTPGDARGAGSWEQVESIGSGGQYLSCGGGFFNTLFGSKPCATKSDTFLPERYWHGMVPVMTDGALFDSTPTVDQQALLFYGGVSSRRLALGNNTDEAGGVDGGREPDLFAACLSTDSSLCQAVQLASGVTV